MPALSVINIRPSGRKVIAQGESKSAITCTRDGPIVDGCAALEPCRASAEQPASKGTRTVHLRVDRIIRLPVVMARLIVMAALQHQSATVLPRSKHAAIGGAGSRIQRPPIAPHTYFKISSRAYFVPT